MLTISAVVMSIGSVTPFGSGALARRGEPDPDLVSMTRAWPNDLIRT